MFKKVLSKIWAEKFLCILNIVLVVLDMASTVILLKIWPNLVHEGNPIVSCSFKEIGMFLTIVHGIFSRIGIPLLLYFSRFPKIWIKFSLSALALPVTCAVVNNLWIMFSIIIKGVP